MSKDQYKDNPEFADIARLKKVLMDKLAVPSFTKPLFSPEYNAPMSYSRPPRRPTPSEVMRVFNAGIGDGETILDTRLLSINGWLTSNGELYACAWRNHHAVLNHFNIRSELVAEQLGFMKLSDMHWHVEGRYEPLNANKRQMATIDLWHEANELSKLYFEHFQKQ